MADKRKSQQRGGQSRSSRSQGGRSAKSRSGSRGGEGGVSREFTLQEREYRGADGQIHHHTHAYMEKHGQRGSQGRSGEGRSSGRSGRR